MAKHSNKCDVCNKSFVMKVCPKCDATWCKDCAKIEKGYPKWTSEFKCPYCKQSNGGIRSVD